MTSDQSQLERGLGDGVLNSSVDDKVEAEHLDGNNDISSPSTDKKAQPARIFEAPESVRNMTAEERQAAESKLRRKIDFRLMPMIILMYVFYLLYRKQGIKESILILLIGIS